MRRLALGILVAVFAMAGQPPGANPQNNTVFSVSTTLVQIDAIVTDKKGRQVSGLQADDFEVLLDGRPQPITNLSYVHLDSPEINTAALSSAMPSRPTPAAAPSYIVKPANVHRSMVLLVDDLSLSFESMYYVRRTLKQFIERQMQPGDLVALWQTGRTNSVFQQFTTDKRVLLAAVDNLNWNSIVGDDGLERGVAERGERGDGGLAHPDSIFPDISKDKDLRPGEPDSGGLSGPDSPPLIKSAHERSLKPGLDEQIFLRSTLTAGAFQTLNELLDQLRQVGGRKSVVFFADGIYLQPLENRNPNVLSYHKQIMEGLRRLVDKANRSGTVLYAVDPRGLTYLKPGKVASLWATQEGLTELAESTGGVATLNTNGFSEAMQQIEEDQKGYYLIGFKAPANIAEMDQPIKKSFHTIQVHVHGSGMHVRSRTGFLGETDAATMPNRDTPESQMRAELFSLFNRADVHVRLSAFYSKTPDGKSTVHNLLYIDPAGIAFHPGETGSREAGIDVMIIASGSSSTPLAQTKRHIAISLSEERLNAVRRKGLLFALDVPVQHPGPYQVRASVRDSNSLLTGSAGQYIFIPDLKKQHIALTTPRMDLAGAEPTGKYNNIPTVLREFKAGTNVSFTFLIETDKDGKDELPARAVDAEVELYRDSTPILQSTVSVAPVPGQTYRAGHGELKLGDGLPAGQYYIEAHVTEQRVSHPRSATTWTDFQVVP